MLPLSPWCHVSIQLTLLSAAVVLFFFPSLPHDQDTLIEGVLCAFIYIFWYSGATVISNEAIG